MQTGPWPLFWTRLLLETPFFRIELGEKKSKSLKNSKINKIKTNENSKNSNETKWKFRKIRKNEIWKIFGLMSSTRSCIFIDAITVWFGALNFFKETIWVAIDNWREFCFLFQFVAGTSICINITIWLCHPTKEILKHRIKNHIVHGIDQERFNEWDSNSQLAETMCYR